MASFPPLQQAGRQPLTTLVAAFVSWKLLLFAIALGSAVGPAYDTSTTLLLPLGQGRFNDSPPSLAERLTRWDGIWFTGNTIEGYSYEQSWAFGAGFPTAVSRLAQVLRAVGWGTEGPIEPLLAIVVANFSHFASAWVLYRLGLALGGDNALALAASLLHVISPAGLFLSAPCAESTFSFLSFSGFLLLAQSVRPGAQSLGRDLSTVFAGLVFGVATTFRSNGILNGVPLAAEFVSLVPGFLASPGLDGARRLCALGVAGILVALGSAGPQLAAYLTFCSDASETGIRPWCRNTIPSIYTFVQEHYWGVGFLRYWTPNNIGLFVLAAPMIYVLTQSALDTINSPTIISPESKSRQQAAANHKSRELLVRSLAASQLLLAVLSVTNYHVQIITRIASGYPIWYLWTAGLLRSKATNPAARRLVRFLIMYGCVQGVLFACFLPPA